MRFFFQAIAATATVPMPPPSRMRTAPPPELPISSSRASVMKLGWIQAVLVGCDRVAANGDTANKIGTSGVAILARHYGIPFYVCSPLSTIDPACRNGSEIPIEERPPEEITEKWYVNRMAHRDARVYNPAFDVTESELITAIVTEKGIVRPPYEKTIPALFGR